VGGFPPPLTGFGWVGGVCGGGGGGGVTCRFVGGAAVGLLPR